MMESPRRNPRRRRRDLEETDFSLDLYNAVVDDDPNKLERLLREGADANHVFFHGMLFVSSKPALSLCCDKGSAECAGVLIDHGANVKFPDKWGLTPLMYSVTVQYPDIIRRILERDPTTTACRDHKGRTALHLAIETGNAEIVKLLIQIGAEVNVQEQFGLTPLSILCSGQFDNELVLLDMLLEAGADVHMTSFRSKRTSLQVM